MSCSACSPTTWSGTCAGPGSRCSSTTKSPRAPRPRRQGEPLPVGRAQGPKQAHGRRRALPLGCDAALRASRRAAATRSACLPTAPASTSSPSQTATPGAGDRPGSRLRARPVVTTDPPATPARTLARAESGYSVGGNFGLRVRLRGVDGRLPNPELLRRFRRGAVPDGPVHRGWPPSRGFCGVSSSAPVQQRARLERSQSPQRYGCEYSYSAQHQDEPSYLPWE